MALVYARVASQILDLPVLELDPLNFHIFFFFLFFHQPKG
jgi:hypothetical protein